MPLSVITDTSCDLPDEELQRYHITMIPLKVTFDDGETFLDRFELTPPVFLKKMRMAKKLPKTAAPDPNTFLEHFERGLRDKGEVLFVSLSSGLSSTFQTAKLACNMLSSEQVKIFDSLTASLGTGITAIKAAQMAAAGLSLDNIVDRLTLMRKDRQVIFTLDTLENVVKGGRLSRVEGLAGTLLNIKPILMGNDRGVPEVVEKVRGRKKAIHRMVNMLSKTSGIPLNERLFGISHVNAEEDAHYLSEMIRKLHNPVNPILISEMSATIGTYAGEGGLMINI
ncbi:DegV family protein [Syntrophomonas palmitatica]|uniref:DegV family protein n=1 Tax=Syntrophomonas palmitatica TaxID=402877 RepID=UPI0006D20A75|nr:DegV family protein [Syntrophomonas palmitatica]